MSWIGGLNTSFNQISSLTGQIGGQISNFTKEVLAEGTEDEVDAEAEIRRLRVKLIETEALVNEKEAEISKHVQTNSALQERARAAQIEASTLSHQYEVKLQEQQKLIEKLKNGENHSEDGFQILGDDDFNPKVSSRRTFSGGSTDAAEFDDVISSQREINRLSLELARIKSERDHWRNQKFSSEASTADADKGMLQAKIKELQDELHQRVDRHQHEFLALQESNAATVRRYQEEIRSLRSQRDGSPLEGGAEQARDSAQKVASLKSEVEELNEKLRTKNRQMQIHKTKLEETKKELEQQTQQRDEFEVNLSCSNAEMLKWKQISQDLELATNERNAALYQALADLRSSLGIIVSDSDAADPIRDIELICESGARLREECDKLRDEKQIAKPGKNWEVDSLQNDPSPSIPPHLMHPLHQSSPRGKTGRDERFLLVADSHDEDCEVSTVGGDLTLTLQALQKQVEEYELEIAQYELVKKEWQTEKSSLQLMLDRYHVELAHTDQSEDKAASKDDITSDAVVIDERASVVADLKRELQELKGARESLEKDKQKLVQEKEQLQIAAANLEEELNMSIADAQDEKDKSETLRKNLDQALVEKKRLEVALKNASDELNSSRVEKAELDEALEVLDSQHQDEMTQLLLIRDELNAKLKKSEEQFAKSKKENAAMEVNVEELRQQAGSAKHSQDSESQLRLHQERLAEVERLRASLEEKLEESQDEVNDLKLKLEENIVQAERDAKETREQLEQVNDNFKESVAKLAELEDSRNRAVAETNIVKQERDCFVAKIADLSAEKDDARAAVAALEGEREQTIAVLDDVKMDREASVARVTELEQENEELVSMLQNQAKEHLDDLQKSESRLDVVEEKRKAMEEEQAATILKMNQLKDEHQRVIQQMEDFHKRSQNSEEELAANLRSKEDEVSKLKSEIDVLKRDERKRIDELVKIHENDEEEGSMLKGEVRRLEERLSSSVKGSDVLQTELESARKRIAIIEKDLLAKDESVSDLNNQINNLKASAAEILQQKIEEYDVKLTETRDLHQKELEELNVEHNTRCEALKAEHISQIETMNNRQEEDLSSLQEQCCTLEEEKLSLEKRISVLSEEASVIRKERDSLLENSEQFKTESNELEEEKRTLIAENLKLKEEKVSLEANCKSLEGAVQAKNNILEDVNSRMETAVEEERAKDAEIESLRDERRQMMNAKQEVEEQLRLIEKRTSDEDKLRTDELQRSGSHLEEMAAARPQLAGQVKQQKSVIETLQHELQVQRSEIVELEKSSERVKSDHDGELRQVEVLHANEKRDLEKTLKDEVKQLESAHQGRLEELKEEHARRLARTITDVKASCQEEITNLRDQVLNLTSRSDSLREELDAMKAREQSLHEEQKLKESQSSIAQDLEERLASALSEAAALSTQLGDEKALREKEVAEFREEIAKLKSVGSTGLISQLPDNQAQEYEVKITEMASELTRLRLEVSEKAQTGHVTSANVETMLHEIRARDMSGLEKSDLSKEDIGSLLELIKERDQVIDALQQKNQTLSSKVDSDAIPASKAFEEKLKELNNEREQVMAVLSEKTKENRQLKDENRRMVDVMAANKATLTKAQEELRHLHEKYEGFDHEMTKETVSRLSKLISEKDLEIESLKQKCQTLLDVLQQQEQSSASNGGAPDQLTVTSQQVQALLRDRETLAQQVRQLLQERDHLVALVNSKHQETLVFQEEARKASEALERDAAENSELQIRYGNLVHDYDQLELKLSSTQRDVAGFKETLNHLEETKDILLSKVEISGDELRSRTPVQTELHSSSSVVMETLRSAPNHEDKSREELEALLERKSQSLLQKDLFLQEKMSSSEKVLEQMQQLQKDQREKDLLIHRKMDESARLGKELKQKSNEVLILRKSVENLREQVSNCTQDADLLRKKVETLEKTAGDKSSECDAYQETNAQLSMMLKEREYETEAMKEKIASLTDILQQSEQGKDSEARKYLGELDRAKDQATSAKHERDQVMLTLKQKQLEAQRANEEAQQLRDKEMKLQSELTRLRSHLVQVEEAYTQEAVLASDREQTLRERLEQVQNKSATVKEASEHSRQQVESLQEQLRSMAAQRDQAVQNFQLVQEQSHRYAAALQQLQAAAERMQREEAATYAAQVEKIKLQFEAKVKEATALAQRAQELKERLDDASEALESASRLNEQLELKEQSIDQLKGIVSEKQLHIEEIQDQLHAIKARSETMVDRELVKNLLTGYFGSPSAKQSDVLRLIASVIGFTEEELKRLEQPRKSWVGGWLSWGRGGSPNSPRPASGSEHVSGDLNESFSQMFVKFLEHESLANQPIARLPAASMAHDAQQRMNQRKFASEGIPTPAFNPPQGDSRDPRERSTVAGRYAPFLAGAAPLSHPTATSKPSSHPLMQPLAPILPTFAPMTEVKPTAERDLLQGILQSDAS